jgi:hypothetical protein
MIPAPDECSCAQRWKLDHDELVRLRVHFEEFRLANDLRLTKLNELREQVQNDRDIYIRADVYQARHAAVQKKMGENESELNDLKRDFIEFKSRIIGIGITLITAAGLLGGIVGHFWK